MKILIVKLSALGDIIHASIILEYIHTRLPKAKIDWVVEERFSSLLEDHPYINKLFKVKLKEFFSSKTARNETFSTLETVRQNRYDIAIDLQGLIKSALFLRLTGAKKRVGFSYKSVREFPAALFYNASFYVPYEENVIYRNIFLVSKAFKLPLSEKDILEKKPSFLSDDTLIPKELKSLEILIVLGSSWQSKIYPEAKLKEVIDSLKNYVIFLSWGSECEKQMGERISNTTHAKLAPKLSLKELTSVIAKAKLVVGGDSGPTHLAWAMNRPSITIYGPTPSWRNSYKTAINKTVDSGEKIDPKKLDKDSKNISLVEPEKIVILAKGLLDG